MDGETFIHTMVNKSIKYNAVHLENDLVWFTVFLEKRLKSFIDHKDSPSVSTLPAPAFSPPVSIYQQFIQSFELNDEERMILLLALLIQLTYPSLKVPYQTGSETATLRV